MGNPYTFLSALFYDICKHFKAVLTDLLTIFVHILYVPAQNTGYADVSHLVP